MIFRDPGFGAQIVKIDPYRCRIEGSHGLNEAFGQVAGEGFNDHIAWYNGWEIRLPATNFDPAHPLYVLAGIYFRAEPRKGGQFIDPQTDLHSIFAR